MLDVWIVANNLGSVHFVAKKKNLPNFGIAKILATYQNFDWISYIVTKIWQQTKCSNFFLTTLPKFSKVENGIKVNRSLVMPQLNLAVGTNLELSPL